MIAEPIAIANLFPVDKNHHMMPKSALVVEHISTRLLIHSKIVIKDLAGRAPGSLACGTRNVPLDVSRKPDGRHPAILIHVVLFIHERVQPGEP